MFLTIALGVAAGIIIAAMLLGQADHFYRVILPVLRWVFRTTLTLAAAVCVVSGVMFLGAFAIGVNEGAPFDKQVISAAMALIFGLSFWLIWNILQEQR